MVMVRRPRTQLMSDLYESDIILWSEHQAEALRRLQAGERRNDVDWDHLIDEVLTVGRNELHAVESLLQRAIEHLLKAAGWPDAQTVPHTGSLRPMASWRGPGATDPGRRVRDQSGTASSHLVETCSTLS